jgi:hypothetical protein
VSDEREGKTMGRRDPLSLLIYVVILIVVIIVLFRLLGIAF